MKGYSPIKIAGFETGLVQEREDFLLVSDAFPVLENAYIWREQLLKKRGKESFQRLSRTFTATALANSAGATYTVTNVLTSAGVVALEEPNASVACGTTTLVFDRGGGNETTLVDTAGDGNLSVSGANNIGFTSGTINYVTGALTVNFGGGVYTVDITFTYYPTLPVMGVRTRELNAISSEEVICFDTQYAYERTASGWQELVSGTTWQGSDSEFFWTTNYWIDSNNNKLFWATNFNNDATNPDPIRYYNGTAWTNFAPLITSTDKLYQARIILPFRGRLLCLNTYEGDSTIPNPQNNATQNPQRIRWSQIGSPIAADSFRQDIRGKGNYLDIPTSEHIVSAGFVRDNLVIYCERSTWQLRYVGRDISPFQIERVNSELGAESTFSAVPFDKSLLGIGDKRIVKCDSFESVPIDIKIPDLTNYIENENDGHTRVHGVRDIGKRLVYWTYPFNDVNGTSNSNVKFPNRMLVYNYENESWGILKDAVTAVGKAWVGSDETWDDVGDVTWDEADFRWEGEQAQESVIVGGNQQGYVHKLNRLSSNDPSLYITAVTGNTTTATTLTVPSHNLESGDIIKVVGIPTGTGYASSLNDTIFAVEYVDEDNFDIYTYNSETDSWSVPQLDASATYVGCGEIEVLDSFRVLTKKFHHMDEGQKIQIGYLDLLMDTTANGEISVNVYVDYQNSVAANNGDDAFINVSVPTTANELDITEAERYWHRAFIPVRGNFLQYELTMSNSQMAAGQSEDYVAVHAVIIHERTAGRMTI